MLKEESTPDSGPFDVGDKVAFGKYKNKTGVIKDVYNDEKDHVAIEIEPESKSGRKKKNVHTGLYKVWPEKP